jgi:hypothetical protein
MRDWRCVEVCLGSRRRRRSLGGRRLVRDEMGRAGAYRALSNWSAEAMVGFGGV